MSAAKQTPHRKTPLIMLTHIENSATGSNLLAYKTESPTAKEVSGILSNGIQVNLTTGSCLKSQFVSLKLVILTTGRKSDLYPTGQITAVQNFGDQILVDIEFKEYDRKVWAALLESFESRQEDVTKLFNRVKGES